MIRWLLALDASRHLPIFFPSPRASSLILPFYSSFSIFLPLALSVFLPSFLPRVVCRAGLLFFASPLRLLSFLFPVPPLVFFPSSLFLPPSPVFFGCTPWALPLRHSPLPAGLVLYGLEWGGVSPVGFACLARSASLPLSSSEPRLPFSFYQPWLACCEASGRVIEQPCRYSP